MQNRLERIIYNIERNVSLLDSYIDQLRKAYFLAKDKGKSELARELACDIDYLECNYYHKGENLTCYS